MYRDYDLKLRRAMGKVAKQTIWTMYGENRDIDSTAEDVVAEGGTYTGFPTGSAEQLRIVSTSADDAEAGTGARTVKISGLLNSSYVEIDPITVTLNGTTPVSLGSGTFIRAARVEVITAGSGGKNAGSLSLYHATTTTNIFATVPVGANRNSNCVYTVPYGKTLYVNRMFAMLARASGGAGSAEITLRARRYGEVFQAMRDPELTQACPFVMFDPNFFEVFAAKTDIKVTVDSVSDANTIVYAELSGILVTDET